MDREMIEKILKLLHQEADKYRTKAEQHKQADYPATAAWCEGVADGFVYAQIILKTKGYPHD